MRSSKRERDRADEEDGRWKKKVEKEKKKAIVGEWHIDFSTLLYKKVHNAMLFRSERLLKFINNGT